MSGKAHTYDDDGKCWCGPELVQPHKDDKGHPFRFAFGWRHHYEGHTCACPNCSSLLLQEPRRTTWKVGNKRQPEVVLLDGEKLPRVSAFCEGAAGWAIILSTEGAGKVHVCETCFEAGCQRALLGQVTVTWKTEASPA